MRTFLMAAFMVSIAFNGLYAQDKTSQLGIGVYDLIFKGTNFPDVKCESYKCNFVSDDNITTMEMKRVDFDLFLKPCVCGNNAVNCIFREWFHANCQ